MAAILDFWMKQFSLFLIYKSSVLSFQISSHLAFPWRKRSKYIFKIAAILDCQWEILYLYLFDLQVTLNNTSYQLLRLQWVNWPQKFCSEVQNRFSRWWPWQPSLIFNLNYFSNFLSTNHHYTSKTVSSQSAFRRRILKTWKIFKMAPVGSSWIFDRNDFHYFLATLPWYMYFLSSFKSIGHLVQEKKFKIDFQDGGNGSHLWFLIWMILVIFYLQVGLPASFKSIDLSIQEKKFKIDFQDSGHLRFLIWTILAIFLSTNHLDTSNEVSNQWHFRLRRTSK